MRIGKSYILCSDDSGIPPETWRLAAVRGKARPVTFRLDASGDEVCLMNPAVLGATIITASRD
jgi:hypothetical protein